MVSFSGDSCIRLYSWLGTYFSYYKGSLYAAAAVMSNKTELKERWFMLQRSDGVKVCLKFYVSDPLPYCKQWLDDLHKDGQNISHIEAYQVIIGESIGKCPS